MHIGKSLFMIAVMPAPALAQAIQDAKPATIVVVGHGSIETAPDRATLMLTIRGEGRTPDAATSALAGRQKAVLSGLRSLDPQLEVQTGSIAISEARAGNCDNGSGFTESHSDQDVAHALDAAADALTDRAQDSSAKGPCIVIGRVAEIEATVILNSVKDAGTAVGLAGRLGAREARVNAFGLRSEADASDRAVTAAIANARAQAQAIAKASGARLGSLISVSDVSDRGGRVLRLYDVNQALAPAVMPAPVVVDITPKPVETEARLIVTFAIER